MVLRQGLGLALAGAAVGLVCALIVSHLMAGLLYGVKPADPLTFRRRRRAIHPGGATGVLHPGAPRHSRRPDRRVEVRVVPQGEVRGPGIEQKFRPATSR